LVIFSLEARILFDQGLEITDGTVWDTHFKYGEPVNIILPTLTI
jgi:hypothetical protein